MLNVEIVEKRNLDRTARKNDARLLDVQKLITTATAALVNASDQLTPRDHDVSLTDLRAAASSRTLRAS